MNSRARIRSGVREIIIEEPVDDTGNALSRHRRQLTTSPRVPGSVGKSSASVPRRHFSDHARCTRYPVAASPHGEDHRSLLDRRCAARSCNLRISIPVTTLRTSQANLDVGARAADGPVSAALKLRLVRSRSASRDLVSGFAPYSVSLGRRVLSPPTSRLLRFPSHPRCCFPDGVGKP